MSINKKYEQKYLKYKKKYLDLQHLFKMKGGDVNCPKIGFHQHKGECWHDALSTILLYNDGISENVQNIFDVSNENESKLIINNKPFSELDISGNEIPQDLLPINFDLDNTDDKKKLIEYAKEYIKYLSGRYINEKKKTQLEL